MIGSETTSLVTQVASIAFRSILLAGGIGALLALLRVKQTSLRLLAWKSVLYGALAMPVLTLIVPVVTIRTPASFRLAAQSSEMFAPKVATAQTMSEGRTSTARPGHSQAPAAVLPSSNTRALASQVPRGTSGSDSTWSLLRWADFAAILYLLVAFALLIRLATGTILARRLVTRSRTISDPRIDARVSSRVRAHQLDAMPQVLESTCIAVPVTVGTIHSTILLPAGWRAWDDAKLDVVIAHEMSHVARRDILTHFLSLLHRALFWFSPLAWWLNRHLSDLAEQASDEAALACGADRNAYARTLLDFFEALQLMPGRVRWQGVSMAKAGQAQQRLERILAWKGAVTMSVKKSIAVAIVVLGIPVLYLAASVRPAGQSPAPQPAVAGAAPAAPQSSAPVTAPAPRASATALPVTTAAPEAPAAIASPTPEGQAAPEAEAAYASDSYSQRGVSSSGNGNGYTYGFDDEYRFVIASGKTDHFTMSGSAMDGRHVEKLKKTIPGDFIWFQRDEKSYIIRDQATIDRARALWQPQEELGRKQEALGKQQEELGRQQEALSKKMEEVRVKVPDMTAEIDALKAKLQKLGPTATMDQIGELQSQIGELQSKMGEFQSEAGEQQSKYGEEQGKLGEQQGKLGEQQGELGRQQGEMAEKATKQMKTLLDEALKNGKAQPEAGSDHDGML